MGSRWWFPFDSMAELAFKRVTDGWLYCAPNPWLLGARRCYVASDEQKSALAAHLRHAWRVLFAAIVGVLGVAMPMAMPAPDHGPLARLGAALLVGLALGAAFNAYLYWRTRPIIADLQPTTQRMTRSDAFTIQVAAFSRGSILLFGLSSLALFALSVLPPLLTSARWDPLSLCGTLLFGAGSVYWFVLYLAKRRQSAD